MLRAVVFDFDGVIANSEPLHFRAFRDVLADWRVDLSETDYYRDYLGFDDLGVFRQLAIDRGLGWSADRLAELVATKAVCMEKLEADVSILFPGADAAVRRAAAAVPIAIASGALGPEIRRVLERERLTACFTCIVGAEDTPASKPAPDPYLLAVAQLGRTMSDLRASECVALEDSPWGLQSAQAAGLRTVGVAQTYDKAALRADAVIGSIDELDVSMLQRLCAD
jgi:beta-phosphoglucomutase-like phosphatase (HAD superfamily)